ncbi:hypothetical protein [Enterococcus sp.]|uniref:hypothetical protein n=1 Tax=Enterococcus sp. TaxID=35783 RepID=UPI002FC642B9
MKKIITYLPLIALIIALRLVGDSLSSKLIVGILICLVVYAKYQRHKGIDNNVEYDERVEANISKWSLRTVYLLNSLLLGILLINQSALLMINISPTFIILYLIATLIIPFYLIPTIMKKL